MKIHSTLILACSLLVLGACQEQEMAEDDVLASDTAADDDTNDSPDGVEDDTAVDEDTLETDTALDDTFEADTVEADVAVDTTAPDTVEPVEPLEVEGNWATNFAFEELVTDAAWGFADLIEYDNDANWAITQNPADSQFSPSAFNKNVWTEPDADGHFWYCTVAFGLETLDDALNDATVADDTDPATMGCGGFGWTGMSPAIEISGSYLAANDALVSISSFTWDAFNVVSYDNDANVAVFSVPDDAATDAGTFGKVTWAELAGSELDICIIATGLASAEDAEAATGDVVAEPDTGCLGGPWTTLIVE